MNVHFIAIGGAAMHNLALALHHQGHTVTGSDDQIFEPSRSRLAKYNLLPPAEGWFPEKITSQIDAIILGMHAKPDNPELQKALAQKIPTYSFPEFLYEQTKHKTRIVIGGSHGKTTITAMIMHVLRKREMPFDYMVGAQLEGFDTMVGFSAESKIAIFEGDEYLSSPLDKRSKFLHYHADIAVINGIAWDHINVFPTFESYLQTFKSFITQLPDEGKLFYYNQDKHLRDLIKNTITQASIEPYKHVEYTPHESGYQVSCNGNTYTMQFFGRHNMQNMEAAHKVCNELGIPSDEFFSAMQSFRGAARRLEQIPNQSPVKLFRDFAHAPSKVKATVEALREMYPNKRMAAVFELHTYSSLTKDFLKDYQNTLQAADKAMVYFNPHTLIIKRLPAISKTEVREAFNRKDLVVYNDSKKLSQDIKTLMKDPPELLLLMSSGNFDNLNITAILEQTEG
jgi:UDP-N-acetylmuramate: L-alanyl-gamma-D-glutamyl-meso-diaminopimelate ligase